MSAEKLEQIVDKQLDKVWGDSFNTGSQQEVDAEWKEMESKLFPTEKKNNRILPFIYIGAAAAAIALLFYVFIPNLSNVDTNTATQWSSDISATNGMQQIRLEDGSSVILAQGSTLRFSENFQTNRQIILDGKAFLTIAKDANHPFVIQSNDYTSTVLGTSFYYNSDEDLKISLFEGKLLVEKKNTNFKKTLLPGDVLQLTHSNTFQLHTLDESQQGTIEFKQSDLLEVMGYLANQRQLKYDIKSTIPNEAITIVLSTEDTLENILQTLSNITHLQFTLENNTVVIQ